MFVKVIFFNIIQSVSGHPIYYIRRKIYLHGCSVLDDNLSHVANYDFFHLRELLILAIKFEESDPSRTKKKPSCNRKAWSIFIFPLRLYTELSCFLRSMPYAKLDSPLNEIRKFDFCRELSKLQNNKKLRVSGP